MIKGILITGNLLFLIFGFFFFVNEVIPSENFFISFLATNFLCLVYLGSKEHYLSAAFGFSFTVAYYVAMCTYFGQYCKTSWYFQSFDYGCDEELNVRSLLVYVVAHSLYFLLQFLFIKNIKWQWNSDDRKLKVRAYNLALFFGALGALLFYLSSYPASTSVAYAGGEAFKPVVPGALLNLLSPMILIIGLVLMAIVDKYDSKVFKRYRLFGLFLMVYFPLRSGDRSGAVGFFIVWFMLFYQLSPVKRANKIISMGIAASLFFIVMTLVASMRAYAYSIGLINALSLGWEDLFKASLEESNGKFSLYIDSSLADAFQQMHWHMINAVKFYDIGLGDNGTSFYNLLPQSVPEVVADLIGFSRPIGATESLRALAPHGGGFYIYAQGYFNFGIMGAFFTALVFGLFIVKCENWFKTHNPIYYGAYFAYLSTMMNGVLYSWQPLIKEMQMLLLLTYLLYFLYRFKFKFKKVEHYPLIETTN